MNGDGNRNQGDNAPRTESRNVDDTYVLDCVTGLYEPRSYASQNQEGQPLPGTLQRRPLFIHANRDRIVIGISIIALGISALTVVLLFETVYWARQQWVQAQRTADASICAANAAQAAVKQAHEQMHLDQRAWVVIDHPNCGDCNVINSLVNVSNLQGEVTNTGKTPAESVKVTFKIHYGAMYWGRSDEHNQPQFEGAKTEPGYPAIIGVVAPGHANPMTFTGNGWQYLIKSKVPGRIPAVYVDGIVTYRTVWGDKGETTFCFFPVYQSRTMQKTENYRNCSTPGSNTMK